jgi:hypothetical protein
VGVATTNAHFVFGDDNQGKEQQPLGYTDAGFGGIKENRGSTGGMAFILAGGAICWASRLLQKTAWSTTEAEYIAAGEGVKEAIWLRSLMKDIGLQQKGPTRIYGDNQAAIAILKSDVASRRTKHIDIAYHFAREAVQAGQVSFQYIRTDEMIADIFTKPLGRIKLEKFRKLLGVSV